LSARPTNQYEDLPVGMVFRSVGYRGVPVPGVPFNDRWGVILNQKGRVVDAGGQPVTGLYASGWIKRGPSGVIGTNKPDSVETVACMLEDVAAGATLQPAHPDAAAMDAMVRERQPNAVSFADWLKLDALETANGKALNRPRVKFTSVAEMLAALGR
jgi:ferredoxin--NADP+ reductase